MTAKHDSVTALRIVAPFAIIVYLYDIVVTLVYLINPTQLDSALRTAASTVGNTVEVGAGLWSFYIVTLLICLVISLIEVRAGFGGLRGHVSKLEVGFCLFVAISSAFYLVGFAFLKEVETSMVIEVAISGIVAFLYWFFGRRVLRETAHAPVTRDDYTKSIKVIGAILVVFGAWNIVEALVGIIDPSAVNLDADTFDMLSASMVQAAIVITLAVSLVFSLAEFHFGYIAYKGRPTRLAARFCLLMAAVTVFAIVGKIVGNGTTSLSDFSEISSLMLAFLYWLYYRRMHAAS